MELLLTTLALLLLVPSLLLIRTKMARRNLPPGRFGWPFVGETMEFLRANWEGCPDKFVRDRVERYGSTVFRTCVFGEPMVFLCGSAGNKFLFSNEGKKVGHWFPAPVRRLSGRSLVFMSGDEARVRKKLIVAGFFNTNLLKNCVPTMDEVTRGYLKTHWQGKEEVQVLPSMKLYTFEVMCRLLMSIIEPEFISGLLFQFNIFLEGMGDLPLNIPGTRFHRAMTAANMIRRELQVFLRQRRVELERNVASPVQDILSYFLVNADKNGKLMQEADIINEMLVLLFAGHNMTTSAISLLIKCLSEQPTVHEKVQREQREVAASKAPGELLSWDDLQRMKYSWNVVCEVLRIAPPSTGTFREALVDITFEGYTIPKGWKLCWSAAYTHNDPTYYPNHMEFDESRFEGTGPPTFSYVPFGRGPRMCLGKEFARLHILVFLHNLINRFDWDLLIHNEKLSYEPLIIPVKGLPIRLTPRISN